MRRHLWSPSYFAGSCGGGPLSIVKQYIDGQTRSRLCPTADGMARIAPKKSVHRLVIAAGSLALPLDGHPNVQDNE
jgi:transposase IS200 family protein